MPVSSAPDLGPIANRVFVLILQHPQEQDRTLGTAGLTVAQLKHARLAVGLSWPNLAKALGRPAEPKNWAVLYLGSAEAVRDRPITALARNGNPLPDQARSLAGIEGLVVLDGSWSQAKALWWRNPWLLRLRRLVLNPSRPSRYGKLRREPRADSVSTLEATAMALGAIEADPTIEAALIRSFETMLDRYRALPHPQSGANQPIHRPDAMAVREDDAV